MYYVLLFSLKFIYLISGSIVENWFKWRVNRNKKIKNDFCWREFLGKCL